MKYIYKIYKWSNYTYSGKTMIMSMHFKLYLQNDRIWYQDMGMG
jgi:hypothetical protein